MIVPIEWLKEYTETDKTAEEIAESLTALGLMLDKPIIRQNVGDILDLEHRMDRADWLSILGCARDLAAMENLDLKTPEGLSRKGKTPKRGGNIPIIVECSDLISRFNTKIIKNVKVGKSPDWLKKRLEAYGIPVINNIVDITNYVMVEYGQPLHAQDLAKFEKREIVIRRAKEGEQITTLDGTVINLDSTMFVLTQNNEPITLGGIVGGAKTAITETTTDIILDAGNYDQANIRHTSRKLGIRNETVLRSEKFLHPHLTQVAIERAVKLILEIAGGDYYENQDWYPEPKDPEKMSLRYDRIKVLGGEEVPAKTVKNILARLEYKILRETPKGLDLEVPYFRTDVIVEDDIVSDILRIGNYKNIKTKMLEHSPPKNITLPEIYLEERLRDIMAKIGGYEYITNPLVEKDAEIKKQVVLENSLSAEQGAMRTSIEQTLELIRKEYNKQGKGGLLFEIGKVYWKGSNEKIQEERHLTVLHTEENDRKQVNKVIKESLGAILKELEIRGTVYRKRSEENKSEDSENAGELTNAHPSAKATVCVYQNNEKLGHLDWNKFTLYVEALIKAKKTKPILVKSHLNKSSLDFSLIAKSGFEMGNVIYEIEQLDHRIIDVAVQEEYAGKEVGADKKSILITVTIAAENLNNEDIRAVQQGIVILVEKKFGLEVRK